MFNTLNHIALILDGNKRWAKKNKLSKIAGYNTGFKKIQEIVNFSLNIKLKNLTLFTLSSENFYRPSVNIIYDIIYNNFSKLLDDLIRKNNIKIKIFGKRDNLPEKIKEIFNEAEKLTNKNTNLNLNLAFNYGFKDEIKQVLLNFKNNLNNINLDNDKDINSLFYLGNLPDPDLLIRTGGYKRISNFIMYNLTYSELFFTKTLWPEFNLKEFEQIIDDYYKINRKYGL